MDLDASHLLEQEKGHYSIKTNELKLAGFVAYGKPGAICVEGPCRAVELFVTGMKRLTWKRLVVRWTEECVVDLKTEEEKSNFLKFDGKFHTIQDDSRKHSDLAAVRHLLDQSGLEDAYFQLFGLQDHTINNDPP
eukprot:GABV01002403.1.p2 GENE.GABV01002403.1~~GABV01002403.1.p2  ORF type:complete len:135 (-),score=39.53 GABV01002403.1:8-412(-)